MKAKSTNRFLYNPARMPEDEFLARFIVRENQFRLLWEEISASRLDMIDQHFLIVGQRGMGKTSLMLKTAYEIGRDQALKDWLVPVVFPEELFGVAELLDLWLTLGELLEDEFPGLSKELKSLAEQNPEHKLIETIRQRLAISKRKLVLFIDNFGDLLDRLDENEIRRLREILMTATDIRLVAASARVMDHTYRYDKPFFDFFNTIYLSGLDKAESMQLMQGLADNAGKRADFDDLLAKHPGRVEAIRRLTGGVPRLLLLLFSSLMEGGETEVMEDLENILDQVSPYYKHRVEDLQSQQRSIFHQVSMAWDAVSTKEIAAATRLESKKISAQLQQMVDNDLLERVETDTKNHLYRLKERFFNIWYLMRMAGSKGASRMKWLVAFLETWLEGPALLRKLQDFSESLREDGSTADADGIDQLLGEILDKQWETVIAEQPIASPDLLPYNLRLKRSFNWQEALAVYQELQQAGIEPNVVTFITLVNRTPSWEEAIWALGEMQRSNVLPNVVTFTTLVNRAPSWEKAIWALGEMQRLNVPPNVVTFTTLINRAPSWEEAIWALGEMQRLNVQPDVVIFTTLVNRAPSWEKAIWALGEMQRSNVLPNVVTFTTLVNRAPSWDEAIWALGEMQRLNVPPDVVTFNTLVNRAPSWEEAIWALGEMQRLNVPPDVVTFNTLVNRAPSWDKAIWALGEMQRLNIPPDVVTFNTLVKRAPSWDKAIWALGEMQRLDVLPNVVTFNTLVKRAQNWEEAIWALGEIQRSSVPPDVVTFNTLVNRAPSWEEAIWALREMQRLNVPPDVVTFNTLWNRATYHDDLYEFLEILKTKWGTISTKKHAVQKALTLLWEGDFLGAQAIITPYYQTNAPNTFHHEFQEFYLTTLLIRHQLHECLNLFETSPHRLKDVFKPIWYALMKLMGEAGRKELLRMGPELQETVDEIVDFVLGMREKYPS